MIILLEISIPLIVLVCAYFILEYSWLIPAPRGLPILMYHKICEQPPDGLTLSPAQFDEQMWYLKDKGYHPISFKTLKSLLSTGAPLPAKAIILTFDDAYLNFKEQAFPILEKYQFSATVFIPVAFIGKTNLWDQGEDMLMSSQDLKQLSNKDLVEFGVHSFLHKSYKEMNVDDMKEDLDNCKKTLDFYGIPFTKVLAYPYGKYPKKDPLLKKEMFMLFQQAGLDFAVRIGNRINRYPIRLPYEMKRIDIRGRDRFFVFRIKVKKGRTKLFS
ncbi:MAG: polysaccharide deacetylase family protein [Bacteroidales bacterium]|nr:polysaccharide deacetylase family protein [Bacteroidales bacterium]